MAAAQEPTPVESAPVRQARAQLADCDTRLAQYRAALDAGADPLVVTGWISEVQEQRRQAAQMLDTPQLQRPTRMSSEQIAELVGQLGDIVTVLQEADPADRAKVYQQLGLRLTYHPAIQKVRVQAQPAADSHGDFSWCPRPNTRDTPTVIASRELACMT